MKITITLTKHQAEEFKKFMHAKQLVGDLHPDYNALDGLGLMVIQEIAKQEREQPLDETGEVSP